MVNILITHDKHFPLVSLMDYQLLLLVLGLFKFWFGLSWSSYQLLMLQQELTIFIVPMSIPFQMYSYFVARSSSLSHFSNHRCFDWSIFFLISNSKFFSDSTLENSFNFNLSTQEELVELAKDILVMDEIKIEKTTEFKRNHSYVSQSAVALRCRVMPPHCFKNPYLKDASEIALDDYGNMRSKCAGTSLYIIIYKPNKALLGASESWTL